MPPNLLLLILGLLFVWLIALTILVWMNYSHYNGLTKGTTDKSLTSILTTLLKQQEINQKDIDSLKKWCDTIEKEGQLHTQKIGLLRFNPFKDTGGDQSFILSVLDKNNTGVIISSLYSRSGTRWYAKQVIEGKGVPHELSTEEKKSIKQ